MHEVILLFCLLLFIIVVVMFCLWLQCRNKVSESDQCKSDSECAGNSELPKCNTSTKKCVASVACDADKKNCSNATGNVCNPIDGNCVQCLQNNNCAAPTSVCNPKSNNCVSCIGDGDCTSPLVSCNPLTNYCQSNQNCTASGMCPENTINEKCSSGLSSNNTGFCGPSPIICSSTAPQNKCPCSVVTGSQAGVSTPPCAVGNQCYSGTTLAAAGTAGVCKTTN